MTIKYPVSYDEFSVPSAPATTTLSKAGDSERNHTQSHADLGDAIEALEKNTALKGHDHSGTDPLNPSNKLKQANTHQEADTDKGASSIHHTIGFGANQAASGAHSHMPMCADRPAMNTTLANWKTISGAVPSVANPCLVYNTADNVAWTNTTSDTTKWRLFDYGVLPQGIIHEKISETKHGGMVCRSMGSSRVFTVYTIKGTSQRRLIQFHVSQSIFSPGDSDWPMGTMYHRIYINDEMLDMRELPFWKVYDSQTYDIYFITPGDGRDIKVQYNEGASAQQDAYSFGGNDGPAVNAGRGTDRLASYFQVIDLGALA